jgi:hypothetical protein
MTHIAIGHCSFALRCYAREKIIRHGNEKIYHSERRASKEVATRCGGAFGVTATLDAGLEQCRASIVAC